MRIHLRRGTRRSAVNRGVAAAAAALVMSSGIAGLAVTGAEAAATGCKVDYSKNDWGTGFTANLTITNLGTAITGWTLKYSYTGNQTL
ncbi:MAG: sle, partial [Actinomycetia bacterium]|nr:sle [Actinomycetes bacterium]